MTRGLKFLACAAIAACVMLYLVWQFSPDLGQTEVSNQPSPDGTFTVFEFRSTDDAAGHAPYGISLALSKGKTLSKPEDGYIFFAGYCNPLVYSWRDNLTIAVTCRGSDTPPLRTHAVLAQGVRIEVKIE